MGSPLEFRAPPPSPVGGSRRETSVANGDVLTEFLRQSLQVPELVLPVGRLLIPTVDLQSTDASAELRDALRTAGCFQLVNHGVPADLLGEALALAATIFQEDDDQFVWRADDCGLRSQLQLLCPNEFSTFSDKMERLSSAMKELYVQILNKADDEKIASHRQELFCSVCCINKHPKKLPVEQRINSFRYDMIQTMIQGSHCPHTPSLHLRETQCLELLPMPDVLIVTASNQIQAWTYGHYNGKPIYKLQHQLENSISMDFLYYPSTCPSQIIEHKNEGQSIITLQQQTLFVVMFAIACQFLLFIYRKF